MTTAQVVETSVTNNSLSKDYLHPNDHDKPVNGSTARLDTTKQKIWGGWEGRDTQKYFVGLWLDNKHVKN